MDDCLKVVSCTEQATLLYQQITAQVIAFCMTIKPQQTTSRVILSIAKEILQILCKLKLSWDEKKNPPRAQTEETGWLTLPYTVSIDKSFIPKSFGDIIPASLL